MADEPLTAAELEAMGQVLLDVIDAARQASDDNMNAGLRCIGCNRRWTHEKKHHEDCPIPAARNALPRLLAAAGEAARLRERVAVLEEMLDDATDRCGFCSAELDCPDCCAARAALAPSPRPGTPEGVTGG